MQADIAIKASSKVNQAGRITSKSAAGRESVGARALARAPIYNKMKAIRGDNPRTTNQRVYLMPVVPSPPPEKPPTPDVEQFSLSFPPALAILLHRHASLLSICLSVCLPLDFSLHSLFLSLSLSVFLSRSLCL